MLIYVQSWQSAEKVSSCHKSDQKKFLFPSTRRNLKEGWVLNLKESDNFSSICLKKYLSIEKLPSLHINLLLPNQIAVSKVVKNERKIIMIIHVQNVHVHMYIKMKKIE